MESFKLIRLSSFGDLEHVLDLVCETWINDPIFACVVPGRRELPHQYKNVWRRILEGEYYKPGTVFLAICKDGTIGSTLRSFSDRVLPDVKSKCISVES